MAENAAFVHPPFKIGWHNFVFTLPPRWEMTSYGMERDSGIMSFASEEGVCGQLSWRKVKAVPDMEKIIAEIDWRSRPEYAAGKPAPPLKFVKTGQSVLAYGKKGERFYASCFLADSRLLAEWIFPSYDDEVFAAVKMMMKGFRENLPGKDSMLSYAAFGLELKVPVEYSLSEIQAYPAAVTLSFTNKKHHMIRAHRWGMAGLLLKKESLEAFYHRYLYEAKNSIKKVEPRKYRGLSGVEVSFRMRGRFGFDFLLGPWWRGQGSAFLAPEENRIYALEHLAPNRLAERFDVSSLLKDKLGELEGAR